MNEVREIRVHRLRIPLTRPYRLAFGSVEHYDTIIVALDDGEGRHAFGEATVLTGYTDETIEESWGAARAFAEEMAVDGLAAAALKIARFAEHHPFTATAFGTALEMAHGTPHLAVAAATAVPLLGLLHATEVPRIEPEFETLLAAGYRTVKVKVGFDAARDARLVAAVQRAVRGRAAIRLDANQGYSAAEGVAFVRALDPEGIELFEQPCTAGDWESHLAVSRASPVPLMLDESIYGLADIERAATLRAARFVKVKLMKFATLERLAQAIERIRALGMTPVLGNGVASDPGCWMEACVAARLIDNAGEMNGFLKPRTGLLDPPLEFRDGAMLLIPHYAPQLSHEALERHAVDGHAWRVRPAPLAATGSST
jgi:o-succinylbenzoate synthase